MKLIIALTCSVLFVAVIEGFAHKKMRAMYKKCCAENNTTMSTVMAAFFDRELPSEREILCTMGCIDVESGVMFPNLTLNETKFKSVLTHMNHLPQENATEIVEICTNALTGITDRCDAAAALFSCTVDNISEEED